MVVSELTKAQTRIDMMWSCFIAFTISLGLALLPLEVMAQLTGGDTSGRGTSVDGAFCNVITWFNGPIGKGIASVALIVVGVGALMGKVSWGMAIIVGIGVAIIFGATELVDAIGGAGSETCTTGTFDGNAV